MLAESLRTTACCSLTSASSCLPLAVLSSQLDGWLTQLAEDDVSHRAASRQVVKVVKSSSRQVVSRQSSVARPSGRQVSRSSAGRAHRRTGIASYIVRQYHAAPSTPHRCGIASTGMARQWHRIASAWQIGWIASLLASYVCTCK